ncbi:DNA glycosylase AlkZ-like family protein [Pseudomonas sp. COR18]|uniref:DNA glycosylase AlkZ-like family protein n=1 Tax=Pseudomonas sp. COR18 TaxID=3399680 RepID=UPI003B0054D4
MSAEWDGCIPTRMAKLAVGLHAARVKTPQMTMVARSQGVSGGFITPPNQCALRKAPVMRSTLHYATECDFPNFHFATRHYRVGRRFNSFSRIGFNAQDVQEMGHALLASIPSGAVSEEEIRALALEILLKKGLPSRSRVTVSHVAWQLTRYLWDDARLKMVNESSSWASEDRAFVVDNSLCSINPDAALDYLLQRYVEAYGPVTRGDIVWWSGLDVRGLTAAIKRLLECGLIYEVSCNSSQKIFYIHRDARFSGPSSVSCSTTPIFLAYEDPFIKAYYETRWRYAGEYGLQALFYKTGEARASVMLDGRIRGVWSLGVKATNHTIMLCPELAPGVRSRIIDCWHEHLLRFDCSQRAEYSVAAHSFL